MVLVEADIASLIKERKLQSLRPMVSSRPWARYKDIYLQRFKHLLKTVQSRQYQNVRPIIKRISLRECQQ